MNEEYAEHIKKCWKWTKDTIPEELPEKNAIEYRMLILDKVVSPYHYYQKNGEGGGTTSSDTNGEPATEKQIRFAEQLGIDNPSQYNKHELSELIDKNK